MSANNRMGRNPFAKSPRAAEIQAAIQEEALEAKAKEKPKARSSKPKEPTAPEIPKSLIQRVARLALIDLPAESFVLALKIRMLARSVLDRG